MIGSTFDAEMSSSSTNPLAGSGPAQWVPVKDPETGRTFFQNEVTKETSWKDPSAEERTQTEDGVVDKSAENTWTALHDSKGRTYYSNAKTKQTSWSLPAGAYVENEEKIFDGMDSELVLADFNPLSDGAAKQMNSGPASRPSAKNDAVELDLNELDDLKIGGNDM
eukprot:SAG31_NODE_9172_length_1322_cov_0.893704_2_plen_166_part_00